MHSFAYLTPDHILASVIIRIQQQSRCPSYGHSGVVTELELAIPVRFPT